MEEMKKKFQSLKQFLQRSLPPNSQPPLSSPPPPDTETPPIIGDDQQHHQQLQPSRAHNVDWADKVIGFCLSWTAAVANLLLQNHATVVVLPLSFHFSSHAIVFALTLLMASKHLYPKSPELAQLLENVGVLYGVVAAFFIITTPFPLCLKLIYWTIFALSLLAIFIYNRHHPRSDG